MSQLSPGQQKLIESLAKRLGAIPGVRAVVLGGSYARGRAQSNSDIDLGILYSELHPFDVGRIRDLAESVNDTPGPVVTGFYGWGRWVNGGAWLTVEGQRVDFVYRNVEQIERVVTDARDGRYELDYAQQPPFGFFSGTYLGEVGICASLFDPDNVLHGLKSRVKNYPEALRGAVVQDFLWSAELNLTAFVRKFAARSDTYGTAACLTRAVSELVMAIFALNSKYPLNDKTALAETADFELVPRDFATRVQHTLSHLGTAGAELLDGVQKVVELHSETAALSSGLYQPRFSLPK